MCIGHTSFKLRLLHCSYVGLTIAEAIFFPYGSTDKDSIDNKLMLIVWCEGQGKHFNFVESHESCTYLTQT